MAALFASGAGGDVKVGVVGVGIAGASHLFDLASSDQFTIAAVCARRRSRAVEAAEWYGAQQVFDDPAAMIAATPLEALVIATPPEVTPAVMRSAWAAGVPTLVDKPAAATDSGLARLAESAAASGWRAVVAYNRRYQQHVHQARDLLASARTAVTAVECVWRGPFVQRFSSAETYRQHAAWGHGVVLDTASHILDTLHFLGFAPLTVTRAQLIQGPSGADVEADITLRWEERDLPVDIRICDDSDEDQWTIRVETTNGTLRLTRDRMVSDLRHPVTVAAVDLHRPVEDLPALAHGGTPLGASLPEAVQVLTVIAQIRAAATRRRPWLRPRAKALGRLNGAC